MNQPATAAQGEIVSEGERNSILVEINPQSVLPLNLQGRSYDEDIWKRVKNHPLRNPTLFQKKLDEDTESREIIRQVMSAAQQRECEVLLHSQARVFQQLLARVYSGFRTFMNEPVVPTLRGPASPLNLTPSDDAPPIQEEEAIPKDNRSEIVKWAAWFATPKYLAILTLGFLGLATGWSQLEIHHLRNSVKAYEQSIDASDDLRDKMNEVVTSNEKETHELRAVLKSEHDRAADLQSKINQATHDAKIQSKETEFKNVKIAELTDQLKKFKDNLKSDEKTAAEKITSITDKRDQLQIENGRLAAEIAKLKEQKTSVDNEVKLLATVQETLVDTRTEFARKKRELTNRIHRLQETEAAYFDSNACVENIKAELNSWNYNHEKVKKHIATFETQREIHTRRIEGRQ